MMRSRPSLKNSAKTGLSLLLALATLSAGCSPPPAPPVYSKEKVQNLIHQTALREFDIDCRARFAGGTLWIYLPVEDIFVPAQGQPEKNLERFTVDYCKANYSTEGSRKGSLTLEYLVKPIHEKQVTNPPYQYNKEVSDKINKLSRVALRVLNDTRYSRDEKIRFLALVVADIKNGFEIKEIMYYPDLKKLSYGIVDAFEYTHRTIQDYNVNPAQIIGDRTGAHLQWEEISMRDFIMKQIEQRVRLKFRKPEVEHQENLDAEIIKSAIYTIRNYNFHDFQRLEFDNLFNNKKITLEYRDVWPQKAK